ncbi:MAG: ferroxidase fet3 [Cyphobasidiales sp. Tagirdzhanova-0007]|nr:MAG: ferroxidase fet3 [Cyphobasidiales sp. Tagirdzhanova-0007]
MGRADQPPGAGTKSDANFRAASFLSGLLLFHSNSVAATTVEVWYNITYAYANPDGLHERRVIGLNNTWPPPPIEINYGDKLVVHAFNGLGDNNTSIHHHGIFFNSSSFYDGAVGVSQCGIPPGESFDYEFDTSINNQSGSYWYHSHFNGQYVDGLRAPLIIHNNPEVHAYDEEFTVSLYDWYHDEHSVLVNQFLNEANPTGAEPVPNSGIIQISQNSAYLPGFSENATLNFQPGKTYRLRFINMSALAMFSFWIDGHQMRVIEVDGTDVVESPIDLITVSVAQRVSVLVTALNDTISNYLIQANMNPQMFDTVPDDLKLNLTANIVYDASSPMAPGSTVDVYTEFPDQGLVPVEAVGQAEADANIQLGVIFATADNGVNRAFFNNITYQTPNVPAYLTAISMGSSSYNASSYGPQTSSFILNHGDNIEIIVINWDTGFHPFHLHGHKFQLVSESYDVSSDDRSINPLVPEGQSNPMRRDTVMVPPGGSRTLRFRADNPGLAAVMIEAPNAIQNDLGAPPAIVQQCAALGFGTSGNAAGINSTTDFTGLAVGPFPQKLGWHAKGIGALAGCIITALLGMATVIWYALGGALDEDELEHQVARSIAKKEAKGSKAKQAKKFLRLAK